jgi:hypothetical protein
MGASMILYNDCVRVLENWGDWSRSGKTRLGYKSRANFYNVGSGALVLDDDLAQLAELALCTMTADNPHNKKHAGLLRLKYYSRCTDRDIARRTEQTLRQVQIGREVAQQLFYDYLCRLNARR